ncbi:unnamed protein product [Acanthoscelides obtectus]|uniref:Uncharacterized protein n=1 Tax=Acanthoscelides obtectus TaxID=200917 RepID=A0A9P0JV55_ACAOB|nr:unnamed protein product [Acanthoscelides obtectus]CAK1667278.1 hypothetical protein AOBTE_LOCUS25756 [Acanthoscelides obtectus]
MKPLYMPLCGSQDPYRSSNGDYI